MVEKCEKVTPFSSAALPPATALTRRHRAAATPKIWLSRLTKTWLKPLAKAVPNGAASDLLLHPPAAAHALTTLQQLIRLRLFSLIC